MSDLTQDPSDYHLEDRAPGDEPEDERNHHDLSFGEGYGAYLAGLGFATLLTIISFVVANTTWVWGPSIPVALAVLAVGQMGVHIVFFLHITGGPDGINNLMALAFGVLIVLLLIGGSLWVMGHMNANMMNMPSMPQIMQMQR
jgi:cytochrome o ubiquinol oxidase operon protein cyoD